MSSELFCPEFGEIMVGVSFLSKIVLVPVGFSTFLGKRQGSFWTHENAENILYSNL